MVVEGANKHGFHLCRCCEFKTIFYTKNAPVWVPANGDDGKALGFLKFFGFMPLIGRPGGGTHDCRCGLTNERTPSMAKILHT